MPFAVESNCLHCAEGQSGARRARVYWAVEEALVSKEELPRLLRESSGMPIESRLSLVTFGCRPRQAAGERRGEGEPELKRRSAPFHPLAIMR